MKRLHYLAGKLPLVGSAYRRLRSWYRGAEAMSKETEQVFTDIFERNAWGDRESVSGEGSNATQTGALVQELSGLLRKLSVSSILDIPCGDFNWMKSVDLRDIEYTGADIVATLIEENRKHYQRSGVRFCKLDVIRGALPTVDLVLCRDCLVHFSFGDLFDALWNLCDSGSTYLLTTTFPERERNKDIRTGKWRAINLERAPFSLPAPLALLREGCTLGDGAYADKSLGLWRITDLREHLPAR